MSDNKYRLLAFVSSALLEARNWEHSHLPSAESALAHEIYLQVAHHTLAGKPLSLHQLFCSINFSETGIRRQLRRLIEGGWCRLEGASNDKRLKLIVAEQKMIESLSAYAQLLADQIIAPLSSFKSQDGT